MLTNELEAGTKVSYNGLVRTVRDVKGSDRYDFKLGYLRAVRFEYLPYAITTAHVPAETEWITENQAAVDGSLSSYTTPLHLQSKIVDRLADEDAIRGEAIDADIKFGRSA